jgi:PAS domain S-box-containing protein
MHPGGLHMTDPETTRKQAKPRRMSGRRTVPALLDAIAGFAFLLAPDHTFRSVNRRFRELFGDPGGRLHHEVLIGRSESLAECPTLRVFVTGAPEEWEWTGPEDRIYRVYDHPHREADGNLCVFEQGIDVTDRKRAKEALSEAEERYRILLEKSLVGFFIVQNRRIVFINPEQRRIFGPVPLDQEVREYPVVHPEDRLKFEQLCDEKHAEDDVKLEMELRIFPYGREPAERTMQWVHCNASLVRVDREKAMLVNMVDITRLKSLERQMIGEAKMSSLGHLAAGVAHEIRNPLSGLNLYLDAMTRLCEEAAELEPETREQAKLLCGMMQSVSEKIEAVVRRIMDFSRPTPPAPSIVDVNQVVRESVQVASLALKRAGVTLTTRLGENLPGIAADPHLFGQVFVNLIVNAGQALERVKGLKEVEVSTSAEDHHVVIVVADSGPGVPPEVMDRIFDPFYTTREEGYGIGLAFSRRIVTEHGGSISVGKSRWGGALFKVMIPADKRGKNESGV